MSLEELNELARVYGVTEDTSLDEVALDALVVLKIIKHCKDKLPELVTGQLLGLDTGSKLEVTNCYPFPSRSEDEMNEAEEQEQAEYQISILRGLREVNVDNNTVGWYTSTFCSFLTSESIINGQYKYQKTINRCVVVVYDPQKIVQGELSFRAYRLAQSFMDLYGEQSSTQER